MTRKIASSLTIGILAGVLIFLLCRTGALSVVLPLHSRSNAVVLAASMGLAVGLIAFLYQLAAVSTFPTQLAKWAPPVIIGFLIASGKDLLPKDIFSSKEWNAWWSTPGKSFSAAAAVVAVLALGFIFARIAAPGLGPFAWGPLRRKFAMTYSCTSKTSSSLTQRRNWNWPRY
jgi:hypothetical protein